jgi:hypothetical protein
MPSPKRIPPTIWRNEVFTVTDRLMAKSIPGAMPGTWHGQEPPERPCLIWTGAFNNHGYPFFSWKGEKWLAHRLSWATYHQEDPGPQRVVDHLCEEPSCIQPTHLDACTQRENLLRGKTTLATLHSAKETCPKGHEYEPKPDHWVAGNLRVCRECARDKAREQQRIIREAAAVLGLSVDAYVSHYGQSARVAQAWVDAYESGPVLP